MDYRAHAATLKTMLVSAARGELSAVGSSFADAGDRWTCLQTIAQLRSDTGSRLHTPVCKNVVVWKKLGEGYDALDVEMSFEGNRRGRDGYPDTSKVIKTSVRAFGTRNGGNRLDLVLVEWSTESRWYLYGEAQARNGGIVMAEWNGKGRGYYYYDSEEVPV